jgi:hypothetical protein
MKCPQCDEHLDVQGKCWWCCGDPDCDLCAWRRKKRDGIHKPIEYYKPLSEQKIHLEERLKELQEAQPDVVAFNLKLTAGEQFVKEQCRSESNQRRRGLFKIWICLKRDPLTLIHIYFETLKKWELQLIEKWPVAYMA